ncbi:MAG TPA: hypothetical protein VEK07_14295 [Polyangiaceae bacterium]|nr:hypothetical protein [Polyangiaceae bacterium]
MNADGTVSGDPSFARVWLPQQNSPTPEVLYDGGTAAATADGGATGNHLPQWVYTYVAYVPPQMPPPATASLIIGGSGPPAGARVAGRAGDHCHGSHGNDLEKARASRKGPRFPRARSRRHRRRR